MFVVCHTNLDLYCEDWPTELPALPNIGDLIQSKVLHTYYDKDEEYIDYISDLEGKPIVFKFQLELEVIRITWKYCEDLVKSGYQMHWVPHIEMHLPKSRFENLTHFNKVYNKVCGRS